LFSSKFRLDVRSSSSFGSPKAFTRISSLGIACKEGSITLVEAPLDPTRFLVTTGSFSSLTPTVDKDSTESSVTISFPLPFLFSSKFRLDVQSSSSFGSSKAFARISSLGIASKEGSISLVEAPLDPSRFLVTTGSLPCNFCVYFKSTSSSSAIEPRLSVPGRYAIQYAKRKSKILTIITLSFSLLRSPISIEKSYKSSFRSKSSLVKVIEQTLANTSPFSSSSFNVRRQSTASHMTFDDSLMLNQYASTASLICIFKSLSFLNVFCKEEIPAPLNTSPPSFKSSSYVSSPETRTPILILSPYLK